MIFRKDPTGTALFVVPHTVTVPKAAARDGLTCLAVVLSFVPWALVLGSLLAAAARSSSLLIVANAFVLGTLLLVNEAVLKPLLKQPRPLTSRLSTGGMPSSHSLEALCAATSLLFSFAPPPVPGPGPWYAQFGRLPTLPGTVDLLGWALASEERGFYASALMQLFWVLLAVPWARVRVGDHSWPQVTVGAAVGVAGTVVLWVPAHALARFLGAGV